MHKVWVINLEEAVGKSISRNLLLQVCCRYLWCVNHGDYFISTIQFPEEYLEYVCALKNLPADYSWIIEIPDVSSYKLTGDAILHCRTAFEKLAQLAKKGTYKIEPYIETAKMIEVAERAGLSIGLTDKKLVNAGFVNQLNNKVYFKKLSAELGIRTIPGGVAGNLQEIQEAVAAIARQGKSKVMIKASNSCGGCGNLSGDMDYISKELKSWYNGDEVLVEPVLNFVETIGSLAVIKENSLDYYGLDCQLINAFCWVGCSYPYDASQFSKKIQECTLQYAGKIQAMGGRGWLNLDWGIECGSDGNYSLIAIEANFRHNGFKYILDVAQEMLTKKQHHAYIKYYMDYPISSRFKNFPALVEKTKAIRLNGESLLITKAGAKGGVLYVSSLQQSKTAVIIVGHSSEYVMKAEKVIKEELSG